MIPWALSQQSYITHWTSSGQTDYPIAEWPYDLVLGEGGVVYFTDQETVGSLNINTGAQPWSYEVPDVNNDVIDITAATADGGIATNLIDLSTNERSLVQIDSSGNAGTPIAALQSAQPSWNGASWYNISGDPLLQQVAGPPAGVVSPWSEPAGDPSLNGQSVIGETLWLRSFAPFEWFGVEPAPPCADDCFRGDNRSFSTSTTGVTSRITGIIKLGLPQMVIISATAYSDPSYDVWGRTATGIPTINAVTKQDGKLQVHIAGSNPLVLGAPDIDTKLNLSARFSSGRVCLSGNLYGDAFPDSEAFIINPENQATTLVRFATTADRNLGPIKLLPGDNNRSMGSFSGLCIGN